MLLLRIIKEYKVATSAENVDWESAHQKHNEILSRQTKDVFKKRHSHPVYTAMKPYRFENVPLSTAFSKAVVLLIISSSLCTKGVAASENMQSFFYVLVKRGLRVLIVLTVQLGGSTGAPTGVAADLLVNEDELKPITPMK